MTNKLIVLTTCANEEEARRLARALVEARLAACAAVHPPQQSYYWWQGQLHQDTEWGVTLKTREDRLAALETELRRQHSYEVPQIVTVPVVAGSEDYLDWMDGVLDGDDCSEA